MEEHEMLKKLVCLLLAALMLFSLVACAKDAEEPASTDDQTTTDTTDTTEETTGEETEDTDETAEPAGDITIGYACSTMAHEWYANIANGAARRAEDRGVTLDIADAAMDSNKQVSYIENFVTQGVDSLIVTPVDPAALGAATMQAKEAGIPMVAESSKFDGMDTFVGITDFDAAYGIGVWMGENATEELKILVIGQPIYEACRLRVDGFKAGLDSTGVAYEVVQEVDGNGTKEDSLAVATDALTAHPEVNVIFGINDNSSTGGMNAYIEQGLDQSKLTVLGFGFEGVVGREALLGDTPYKAAVAMFPEYVGAKIVDAAIDAANGEAQEEYMIPTVVITKENFDQFYTQDEEGNYLTNFDAIDQLLAEQSK